MASFWDFGKSAAAAGAGSAATAPGGDEEDTSCDKPALIEPGLLIGSYETEQDKKMLLAAGVTHVLQMADGLTPSHPHTFTYMGVELLDWMNQDLVKHFSGAFKFIDQAQEQKGACLVHCLAGISRSASVCIGYLMQKHRITYDEAFRRVKTARPIISPNPGFQKQLKVFEQLGYDLSQWRGWPHNYQLGQEAAQQPTAAAVPLAGPGVTPPAGVSNGVANDQPGPASAPDVAVDSTGGTDTAEAPEEEDDFFKLAVIQPGLLISSYFATKNKRKMQAAGITHVLLVAEEVAPSHPDTFAYMRVEVTDREDEDLVAHFDRAFKFIDQAQELKGACLVHCAMGISRSATVCIGYLMHKHRITYDEAFRRVHEVRPCISPNPGFQLQLETFEQLGYDLRQWRGWPNPEGHDCEEPAEEPTAVESLTGLNIKAPAGPVSGAEGPANGTG